MLCIGCVIVLVLAVVVNGEHTKEVGDHPARLRVHYIRIEDCIVVVKPPHAEVWTEMIGVRRSYQTLAAVGGKQSVVPLEDR